MTHTGRLVLIGALAVGSALSARAQNETPLTRNEVSLFKKKLVAALEALGQPPSGYSQERESFNLPTEAYRAGTGSNYRPVNAGASRTYGSAMSAENASKAFEEEYQTKILEAQAKGDYEAMGKLAQEMQAKASALALQAQQERKEPVEVRVELNGWASSTIDPDAVLLEQPGVIVLKRLDTPPDRGDVTIYVDPVNLRDPAQLAKVSLEQPEEGTAQKTAVLTATVSLRGPAATVEAWAKKVNFPQILSQIDR